MKTNPDIYLLYEYMKKIPFTVRIKVVLDAPVDEGRLKEAAREAIRRFHGKLNALAPRPEKQQRAKLLRQLLGGADDRSLYRFRADQTQADASPADSCLLGDRHYMTLYHSLSTEKTPNSGLICLKLFNPTGFG